MTAKPLQPLPDGHNEHQLSAIIGFQGFPLNPMMPCNEGKGDLVG